VLILLTGLQCTLLVDDIIKTQSEEKKSSKSGAGTPQKKKKKKPAAGQNNQGGPRAKTPNRVCGRSDQPADLSTRHQSACSYRGASTALY